MATKLTKNEIKRLENLGITSLKTVEEATAKAIKKLNEIDCIGFDDEELDTMLSILETYATDSGVVEELEDEPIEDDFAVEANTEETESVENDEMGWEDKKISDDDICDTIRLELAVSEKSGDLPKDEPEPKVKKQNWKKPSTSAPVSKKETAKPAAKVEKPAPKEEAKPVPKAITAKWNPLENEADRKLFDSFDELFPQKSDEYEWKWAKDGLTVKYKGANNMRVICYLTSSSSQKIKIWLPCLIGKSEMLDELNIDYNDRNWNRTPIINQLTVDEAVEIMKEIKDGVMKVVREHDSRLGV